MKLSNIEKDNWYTISDLMNQDWFFGGLTRHQIASYIKRKRLKARNVGVGKRIIYRIQGKEIRDFLKREKKKGILNMFK